MQMLKLKLTSGCVRQPSVDVDMDVDVDVDADADAKTEVDFRLCPPAIHGHRHGCRRGRGCGRGRRRGFGRRSVLSTSPPPQISRSPSSSTSLPVHCKLPTEILTSPAPVQTFDCFRIIKASNPCITGLNI